MENTLTPFNKRAFAPGKYTSAAIDLPSMLSYLQVDLGIESLTNPAVKVSYGFESSSDGINWRHAFGGGLYGMPTPLLDHNGNPVTLSKIWKEFDDKSYQDLKNLGNKIRGFILVAGGNATIGPCVLRWK